MEDLLGTVEDRLEVAEKNVGEDEEGATVDPLIRQSFLIRSGLNIWTVDDRRMGSHWTSAEWTSRT